MITIKRIISTTKLPVLLFFLSALTGCIEIDARLTLNSDGSGTVILTEILTGSGIKRLKDMEKSGQIPSIDIAGYFKSINESELTRRAEVYSKGLTFSTFRPLHLPDGGIGIRAVYSFTDINQVKFYTSSRRNHASLTFALNGTILTVSSMIKPQERSEAVRTIHVLNGMLPAYQEAFTGMKARVTLSTAESFIKTDATYVNQEKDCITILDIDIGKLIATPAAIDKLIEFIGTESSTKQTLPLQYNDWLKLEPGDSVTVRLQDSRKE